MGNTSSSAFSSAPPAPRGTGTAIAAAKFAALHAQVQDQVDATASESPAPKSASEFPAPKPASELRAPKPLPRRQTTETTHIGVGKVTVVESEESTSSRMVRELRPKPGLAIHPTMNVAQAAQLMAAAKQDCCLVLSADTVLVGILTDTDVVRKVLAAGLEPKDVVVQEIMTTQPICIAETCSVTEALATMRKLHCRHLPVVDGMRVVGLLDIAKLLFDVMLAVQERGCAADTLAQVVRSEKRSGALSSQRVLQAAVLMSERQSAMVVTSKDGAKTVGILTPKDLLFRAVAANLPAATSTVGEVMTESPEVLPASATILQALHQLSTGGYRTVPVVDTDGRPIGVLDVLALVEAALTPPPPADPPPADLVPSAPPSVTATEGGVSSALLSISLIVSLGVIALALNGRRPRT